MPLNLPKNEEETVSMMNVEEIARMIEWLCRKGMSDTDINNCLTCIATGIGLPVEEPPRAAS